VQDAVQDARVVAVSEIGYVEARSALARKEREGAFSTEEHDAAVEQLRQDFREVYLPRPVTGDVVARAGELAHKHALRAYDAVHLATALVLREEAQELARVARETEEPSPQEGDEPRISMMTFDASLAGAAGDEGLAHPEQPSREER
jgi:predicted nucleic acid-binding protein